MNNSIIQILSAMLYGGTGLCLLLILLNRVIFLMPDSKGKNPAILIAFSILVGLSSIAGFILAQTLWSVLPISVLAILLIGEVQRIRTHTACTGMRPLDTTPHSFDLASPITTTNLIIHRYRLEHPKWKGAPLRIAHLSDLHANAALPLEYYQEVLETAEGFKPDIALFTGDFITRTDDLKTLEKFLRPIATLETYAVLGNHDYWSDPDSIRQMIKNSGIRLISNESVMTSIHDNPIIITGYDYPWGTNEKCIPTPKTDALHLVLSHTPDNIYRLSKSSADVVFSGHYHAGQMRIPIIGPLIIPSVYGRRFDQGHFIVNDTDLFITGGIGAAYPPLRIYCQPDLFIVDIVQKS